MQRRETGVRESLRERLLDHSELTRLGRKDVAEAARRSDRTLLIHIGVKPSK